MVWGGQIEKNETSSLTVMHRPRQRHCNFCLKPFPKASRIRAHIQNSPACRAKWDREVARRPYLAGTSQAADPPISAPHDRDHTHHPNDLALEEFADSFANDPRMASPERDQPPSKRVRVEEVPDEGEPTRYCRAYPEQAADILGIQNTNFEKMREQQTASDSPDNRWAPFLNEEEWELAEWLITETTQKGRDKFLKLPIVGVFSHRCDTWNSPQTTCQTKSRTQPSYTSNHTFLKKVDALSPGPGWTCEAVHMTGDHIGPANIPIVEELELWRRDPVECVQELIGNPAFLGSMSFAPEQVYEDAGGQTRVFDEMWTGDWWWEMQVRVLIYFISLQPLTGRLKCRLPSGATITPILLASDKTHLTDFGGDKSAWPVYLTIGNISKEICRQPSSHATILVGYLPVSKFSAFEQPNRALARYDAFHHCMRLLLEPLIEAGRQGVLMTCADRKIHRIFPILAAYIADYPEQCLVVCCKENWCPRCVVLPNERGDFTTHRMRDPKSTLHTLRRHQNGEDPHLFEDEGLRAVYYPFWADLPHADIFQCMSPDILHQLHKGVFKDHLVPWISSIVSPAELDVRFQSMSKFQGLRHFKDGITTVSQWTGKELKEMQRVFLGVIAGLVNDRVFAAAKALLDFIYLAQYQSHTETSLSQLQAALEQFHSNKDVFVEAGVRVDFNIPKLHSIMHYLAAIRSLGSADGFNTESPERCHAVKWFHAEKWTALLKF